MIAIFCSTHMHTMVTLASMAYHNSSMGGPDSIAEMTATGALQFMDHEVLTFALPPILKSHGPQINYNADVCILFYPDGRSDTAQPGNAAYTLL